MPALKCPTCQKSDLHAVQVNVESIRDIDRPHHHRDELACKQCGWTPSSQSKDEILLTSHPLDSNV